MVTNIKDDATLVVRDLHTYYGDSHILQGLNISIQPGEVVALLGRNGVGKTTFFKTLIGILPIGGGDIIFDGTSLKGLKQHMIARRGIGYVPQGREVFADLTIKENLLVGCMAAKTNKIPEAIFEYFPILKERLSQKAGTLSGGQQQMLAIGRALACNPRLLLLDEPTEGIQPNIVDDISGIIKRINKELNLSIIVVEQNLDFAYNTAERFYIMEKGQIVDEGKIDENSAAIIEKHLTI